MFLPNMKKYKAVFIPVQNPPAEQNIQSDRVTSITGQPTWTGLSRATPRLPRGLCEADPLPLHDEQTVSWTGLLARANKREGRSKTPALPRGHLTLFYFDVSYSDIRAQGYSKGTVQSTRSLHWEETAVLH